MNPVVKFQIERANSPSLKERVFEHPDPSIIDMEIGTVLEINFENDCYYADFKIKNKTISQVINNEGEVIKEYVYTLEYVPRTTKTKSEYEKAQEELTISKTTSIYDHFNL